MPVTHHFMPFLYAREIFNPAGAIIATQIHATEHPFVVLEGRLRVFVPGGEPVELAAGHLGITMPGTRRAILALEDTRFATFHVLTREEENARAAGAPEAELVEAIGARILGTRERVHGRDVFAEYKEKLAAAGLPGPNDGARQLPQGGEG